MRLLLLTRNFPPRTCGVGDYACHLAESLAAAGNEVSVLTEPAAHRKELPFPVRELPLTGWSDYQTVLAAIERAAPDRVQLEYAGYGWNSWGTAWWLNALLLALRQRKIPVHIGLHEIAIGMRQHPLQLPVALAQWVHIGLLIAAAETVAVNLPSRVTLLGRVFPWWRARLRYRPNSSNIPVVPLASSERSALRRERGVARGDAVVATFGMFHRDKNYQALISAFALLRRTRSAKLWMLGDVAMAAPDYRQQLQALVREEGVEQDVWWSGRLDDAEVSRALQAADVFVLPQPDGHLTRSGAFMAAAAHGLPVVAVRDPGNCGQQEFRHGENIWLVERSTPQPIVEALRILLDDLTVAGLLGLNLQRLYTAKFSWSRAIVESRGTMQREHAIRRTTGSGEGRDRAAAAAAPARINVK